MAVEVKRDGAVAVVTVTRPEVMNALNSGDQPGIADKGGPPSEIARRRLNVRAVVLTGAGEKAFVAGADIAEFSRS